LYNGTIKQSEKEITRRKQSENRDHNTLKERGRKMVRQVRCRFCGDRGHNIRGCPDLKQKIAQEATEEGPAEHKYHTRNYGHYFDKQGKSARTCSYCKEQGHTKKTCQQYKKDNAERIKNNVRFRYYVKEELFKKAGLNIGSLVYAPTNNSYSNPDINGTFVYSPSCNAGITTKERQECYIITGFDFKSITDGRACWDAIEVIRLGAKLTDKMSLRFPFRLAAHSYSRNNEYNPSPYVDRENRLEGLVLGRHFLDFVVLSPTPYDENIIPNNWELGVEGLDS